MRQFNEDTLTDAVVARLKKTKNPRLREIMTAAVKHLHAFARDVKLTGQNFTSQVDGRTATTGAFVPFGTSTTPGQVIKGQVPCSGAILRIPPRGGTPQLVA